MKNIFSFLRRLFDAFSPRVLNGGRTGVDTIVRQPLSAPAFSGSIAVVETTIEQPLSNSVAISRLVTNSTVEGHSTLGRGSFNNRHRALCIVNRQSLKFRKVASLLCVLLLGIGNMWGAIDLSTLTYNGGATFPSSSVYKYYGGSAGVTTTMPTPASISGTNGINITSGGGGTYNKKALAFTVDVKCTLSVTMIASGNSKVMSLYQGSSTAVETVSMAKKNEPYTLTYEIEANTEYSVSANSSNIYVTQISFTSSSSETLANIALVASPTGAGTFTVGGSTVTSTKAGKTTKPAVTAVPATGYNFTSWAITGGSHTISSTTDNPTTITGDGTTTAGTLTATFTATSGGSAPSITTQPTNVTNAVVGTQTSLTVEASGATSYQWQSSPSESGTYTNISSGGTSATLNVTPSAEGTVYYKCVVSNSHGSTTSNIVHITATSGGGGERTLFSLEMKTDFTNLSLAKNGGEQELNSTYAIITGGTALVKNTDASNDGKMQLTSNNGIYYNGNNAYTYISLNEALHESDVITFTSGNSNQICFTVDATRATTIQTSNKSYTIPAESPLIGKTEFYIWRNSSSTYIKTLTIKTTASASSGYDATFSSTRGTAPAKQTGKTSITLSQITGVTGYDNDYWTADKGTKVGSTSKSVGDQLNNGDVVTLLENTTFTAHWTAKQYTITYKDKDGATFSGTHADGAPAQYTYGVGATLQDATKTGYTFGGWFIAQDCSGDPVTSIGTDAHENKTLYAKWTENLATISLVASPTGAGTFTINSQAAISAQAGVVTKPAVTAVPATGYNFYSWAITGGSHTISSTTDNPTTITGDGTTTEGTLTATFTPQRYDITYLDQGDADYSGSNFESLPKKYTYGQTTTLVDGVKEGYTFGGWFIAQDCSGDPVTSIGTDAHENKTFYAKWTAIEYKITYGGLKEGANAPSKQSYTIEEAVTLEAPTNIPTGYTFDGWYDGDNKVTSIPLGSTGDKSFTAHWKMTITYDMQGHGDPISSFDIVEGNAWYAPTAPAAYGWNFLGWHIGSADGELAQSGTWTPSAPTTLYAEWAEDLSTVWYMKGTFVDNWETKYDFAKATGRSTEKVASVTVQNLSANADYWFQIWDNTNHGATADNQKMYYNNTGWYLDGNKNVGVHTTAAGDYIFTVDFSGNDPKLTVTYPEFVTVTVNFNGHGGNNYELYTSPNGTISQPDDPSADGFTFVGWFANEACTTPFDFAAPIAANTTIYAKWSQAYYYHEAWGDWKANEMTCSEDGTYWYWYTYASSENREFKIQKNATWYDRAYNSPGYHCTDIANMNSSDNSWNTEDYRCAVNYNGGRYYIIVYVPNTGVNKTNNPIICASTFLPESSYSTNAGNKIYFDNSETNWSNVYFRIGHKCWTNKIDMTKVPGTQNLYSCTTTEFTDYNAFHVADNTAWTDAHSIYAVRPGSYDINNCLSFIKENITTDITLVPTTTEGGSPNYYGYNKSYGMLTHKVAVAASDQGTITVSYTDTESQSQSLTNNQNADLAHTCILTISGTPATGYTLGNILVNGETYTQSTLVLTENVTISATWNPIPYELTWDFAGGSTTDEGYTKAGQVPFATSIDYPANNTMSKTGYAFAGWDKTILTMPAKATTITATWTANHYTVTLVDYDGQGGEANITVAYDSVCPSDQIKELTISKTGYDFGGFGIFDGVNYENYIKLDGSTYKFEGSRPGYTNSQLWKRDGGATFTAKWTAHTHKVTFNLDGGSGYTDMKDVAYGTEINVATDPVRTGYSFTGWTATGITLPESRIFTMPDNDVTLLAGWLVNSYNVTPTLTHCTATIPATANYGTSFSTTISAATGYNLPSEVTITGATLSGWSAETGALSITNVTGAVTITVTADPINYTITYNDVEGATHDNPATYTIETPTITLQDASKSGSNFLGWYDDSENKVTSIAQGTTGNISLTAKWAKELQTPTIKDWTDVPTKVYKGGQYTFTVSTNSDADLSNCLSVTAGTGASVSTLSVSDADGDYRTITAALTINATTAAGSFSIKLDIPDGDTYKSATETKSNITLGSCESAQTYTMTILDGSTMSVGPVPTSGSEANSGATWSAAYGANGSDLGTCNFTVDGKNYSHFLNVLNSATSDNKNYIEIVIPEGYEAVFYLVGSTNSSSKVRGQWISKTKSGTTIDESIAYVSKSGYDPGVVTSEPQEAGTYYYCSDASIRTYELTVTLTGGAGDAPQDPKLAWKSGVTTKSVDYQSANFTELATAKSAGAISYSSDAPSVASVDSETGEVTIGNVGTATISASIAENGCYTASTNPISYTITVNKLQLVAPTVTTNFADAAYYACETVTPLTVTATNEDTHDDSKLSYQWYKDNVAIEGEEENTYTPSESGSYMCKVTCSWNDYCTPATTQSETKTITIYDPVSFITHPKTASYRNNEDMDPLTVSVSGGDGEYYEYQWQEFTDNEKWVASTKDGYNTASLTLGKAELPGDEAVVNHYRCLVTSNGKCEPVISDVATITINNKYTETFTWTGIEGQTFYPTGRYTISVSGLQRIPDLSFTDGAIDIESNATEGTTRTCTFVVNEDVDAIRVTASIEGNEEYFGKEESKNLTIGDCKDAPKPELTWSDDLEDDALFDKDCDAANFTYTASSNSASTGAITYSSSNPDVATVSAFGEVQINGVRGTTTITATQEKSGCFPMSQITYTINVPIVYITKQPVGASYLVGDKAEPLEVIATGKDIHYQWQSSTNNIDWVGITTDGNGTTYTPSTLEHSTIYYRCQMTSGTNCGTVETNVAEVEVCGHYPVVTAPTTAQTLNAIVDEAVTLHITAAPHTDVDVDAWGLHYQWYKGEEAISGATDAAYTIEQVKTTDAGTYYCKVSEDGGCYTVTSPAFTLSVTGTEPTCDWKEIVKAELNSSSSAAITGTMANKVSPNFSNLSGTEAPFKLNGKPSYFGISLADGFQKGDSVTIHWEQAANSTTMQLFTSSDATDCIVEQTDLNKSQEYTMSFELPKDVNGLYMIRTTDNNQNHKIYSISVKRYACDEGIMAFMDYTGDGKWSTVANWAGTTTPATSLPTIGTITQIKADVTVSEKDAQAARVDLCDNSTLTIAPTGGLNVAGKVQHEDGSATTVSDIIIQSTTAGNGALVFNNNDGQSAATVQLYSKAYSEKNDAGKTLKYWQYIGMPTYVDDVLDIFEGASLYRYDEMRGWLVTKAYNPAYTWYGYGVSYSKVQDYHQTYTFAGSLVETTTKEIALTKTADEGNGENMVANSWTAPINIRQFDLSDFDGAEATVYIFNTGRDRKEYGGEAEIWQSEDNTTAGQWATYPINTVKQSTWKGATTIASLQAFQVNVAAGEEEATLTLDYDRLVRPATGNSIGDNVMRAPARQTEDTEIEPEMMWMRVADTNTRADIYLLQRNDFSANWDNGWDGSCFDGDGRSPEFYSVSDELGKMTVQATDDWEGTAIGFAPAKAMVHTISFDYNGMTMWYLNDIKEQKSTLIDAANTYTFTSEEGDGEERFYLSQTPFRQDISTRHNEIFNKGNQVHKIIYREHMYIIIDGQLYDGTGKLVKRQR